MFYRRRSRLPLGGGRCRILWRPFGAGGADWLEGLVLALFLVEVCMYLCMYLFVTMLRVSQ